MWFNIQQIKDQVRTNAVNIGKKFTRNLIKEIKTTLKQLKYYL